MVAVTRLMSPSPVTVEPARDLAALNKRVHQVMGRDVMGALDRQD